jgi:hypothetical protein
LHGTLRLQGDLSAGRGCIPEELKAEQEKDQHSGGHKKRPQWSRRPEAARAEAADGPTRPALVGLTLHLLE